jgi:hypothetical protein
MSHKQQIERLTELLKVYENELQVTMPNFAEQILQIVPVKKSLTKEPAQKHDFFKDGSRHASPTVEVAMEECSLDSSEDEIKACDNCSEIHDLTMRDCQVCYERHDGCCQIVIH